ncbi:MAG: PadR family transcriptional regulator [Gammaproteobacteria bacterium]|nr:PadR family transcriptional regulator [Gammaproteobacteria bacterium]
MALRYAILISLHEEAATGYEITKKFDQGMGFFWQASHQQIYLELKKMSDLGLVEFQHIEQDSKPDKKLYQITSQGIQALKDWLIQPVKTQTIKDSLLMKLYAGPLGSAQHLLDEVLRIKQEHVELLETFHAIEQEWFQNIDQQPLPYQYIYYTLRNGIHYVQSWLAWSEEVIPFLEKQAGAATR